METNRAIITPRFPQSIGSIQQFFIGQLPCKWPTQDQAKVVFRHSVNSLGIGMPWPGTTVHLAANRLGVIPRIARRRPDRHTAVPVFMLAMHDSPRMCSRASLSDRPTGRFRITQSLSNLLVWMARQSHLQSLALAWKTTPLEARGLRPPGLATASGRSLAMQTSIGTTRRHVLISNFSVRGPRQRKVKCRHPAPCPSHPLSFPSPVLPIPCPSHPLSFPSPVLPIHGNPQKSVPIKKLGVVDQSPNDVDRGCAFGATRLDVLLHRLDLL